MGISCPLGAPPYEAQQMMNVDCDMHSAKKQEGLAWPATKGSSFATEVL